jgi:F5/8 type C domain-containing protein
MRFLTNNLATEAATTITASTANTNFPASNLSNPLRSKVWRSTSVTAQSIVFDLVTTEPINSIVLLWPKENGIRLTDAAVIKIQANATNVWTSPAVDQTLTINNDYSVASHFFTSDQNYRYWRVTITDPTNPYGYLELGVVWLGKALDIENAQNGFTHKLIDQSKVTRNDFGHEYVDEYPLTSVLEFSYLNIEYDTQVILENAYRTNGRRKPVLVALDAEENVYDKDHFLVYGKITSGFGSNHVSYNIFSTDNIVIEELA